MIHSNKSLLNTFYVMLLLPKGEKTMRDYFSEEKKNHKSYYLLKRYYESKYLKGTDIFTILLIKIEFTTIKWLTPSHQAEAGTAKCHLTAV